MRGFAAAFALLVVAPAARAEAPPSVDLLGAWHVLVHYRDSASEDPAAERWEDRVWTFEREGSRLLWSEFPILVFRDESGRFANVGTRRQRRVLRHWQPSPEQLAEIRAGLEYNTRDSRSKSLRGSEKRGYRSVGSMRSQSASVISYVENWSIEGLPQRPVFTRDDVMGSARAETMRGRTCYTTLEVSPDGELLTGLYERDGERSGTFQMRRAGALRALDARASEDERPRYLYFADLSGVLAAAGPEEQVRAQLEQGKLPEASRRAMRAEITRALEENLRENGEIPADFREPTATVTAEIERLLVEERRGVDEIHELLRDGRLQP